MRIKITMDMGGYSEWEREDLIQVTISSQIGGGYRFSTPYDDRGPLYWKEVDANRQRWLEEWNRRTFVRHRWKCDRKEEE